MEKIKKVHICGLSDTGKTREHNEDAFLIGNVVERTGFLDVTFDIDSFSMQEQGFLVAVADGMGGAAGGEVASILALNTFSRHYYSRTYKNALPDEILESLKKSILTAHRVLSDTSAHKPELKNMGTTIVGLTFLKDKLYRFHAGDSRLYRFRDGYIRQITKDHSLVQALVDARQLDRDEAKESSRKNEILNSLGGGGECTPEVAILQEGEFRAGDILLLCSDGLSDMLDLEIVPENLSDLEKFMKKLEFKQEQLNEIKNNLCSDESYEVQKKLLEEISENITENKSTGLKFWGKSESKEKPPENPLEKFISNWESSQKDLANSYQKLEKFSSELQKIKQDLSFFLINKEENLLEKVLRKNLSLAEKAQNLINLANERISKDNVTAILIELKKET